MAPPALSPDIADVLAASGMALAVLHGSRADGRSHPGSDTDIGVLGGDGRSLGYSALARLQLELCDRLGAEVDLSDLSTPDAIFRREVASRGRLLFEDRPGRFAEFVARALIDYDDIARFVPEMIRGVARAARAATSPDPRRPGSAG